MSEILNPNELLWYHLTSLTPSPAVPHNPWPSSIVPSCLQLSLGDHLTKDQNKQILGFLFKAPLCICLPFEKVMPALWSVSYLGPWYNKGRFGQLTFHYLMFVVHGVFIKAGLQRPQCMTQSYWSSRSLYHQSAAETQGTTFCASLSYRNTWDISLQQSVMQGTSRLRPTACLLVFCHIQLTTRV